MPLADLGGSIRRLREAQRLSLRGLANATGLSASFLSQVENGQASPSIASMERIAAGLGVRLAEFFNQADAPPTVVKAGARLLLTSEWSKARIERLSAGAGPGGVDAVLVTIEPGGMSGKHAYAAPREEFAIVLLGPTTLTLGESEQVLNTGDAVTIPTGVGRRWQNSNDAPVVILMASSR